MQVPPPFCGSSLLAKRVSSLAEEASPRKTPVSTQATAAGRTTPAPAGQTSQSSSATETCSSRPQQADDTGPSSDYCGPADSGGYNAFNAAEQRLTTGVSPKGPLRDECDDHYTNSDQSSHETHSGSTGSDLQTLLIRCLVHRATAPLAEQLFRPTFARKQAGPEQKAYVSLAVHSDGAGGTSQELPNRQGIELSEGHGQGGQKESDGPKENDGQNGPNRAEDGKRPPDPPDGRAEGGEGTPDKQSQSASGEAAVIELKDVEVRLPVAFRHVDELPLELLSATTGAGKTDQLPALTKRGRSAATFLPSFVWTLGAPFGIVQPAGRVFERKLITDISGTFLPGRLVALLGPSGAGKTTLLNVLAGRVRHTTGLIRFNGALVESTGEVRSGSAYIQQLDLFSSKLTVEEHLLSQIRLRAPHLTPPEMKALCLQLLLRFGLRKCAHTIIGAIADGISGGERKRLSVATEVVNNPRLLLADEPTSGLDSHMAISVVTALRALADSGRSVVASLHQPSTRVFSLFDELILMSEGRVLYFGDRLGAVEWFNRLGFDCPKLANPADFLIRSVSLPQSSEPAARLAKLEQLSRFAAKWQVEGDSFLAWWTDRGRYDFFRSSKTFAARNITAVLSDTAAATSDACSVAAASLRRFVEQATFLDKVEEVGVEEGEKLPPPPNPTTSLASFVLPPEATAQSRPDGISSAAQPLCCELRHTTSFAHSEGPCQYGGRELLAENGGCAACHRSGSSRFSPHTAPALEPCLQRRVDLELRRLFAHPSPRVSTRERTAPMTGGRRSFEPPADADLEAEFGSAIRRAAFSQQPPCGLNVVSISPEAPSAASVTLSTLARARSSASPVSLQPPGGGMQSNSPPTFGPEGGSSEFAATSNFSPESLLPTTLLPVWVNVAPGRRDGSSHDDEVVVAACDPPLPGPAAAAATAAAAAVPAKAWKDDIATPFDSGARPRKTTWSEQFTILLQREFVCLRRDSLLLHARICQMLLVGGVLTSIFWRLGDTDADARAKLSAIFFLICNQGLVAAIGVCSTFTQEKVIAAREIEAGVSRVTSYVLAKITADLPVQTILPACFTAICYWGMNLGQSWTVFGGMIMVTILVSWSAISVGYLGSACAGNSDQALMFAQIWAIPALLFAGFVVNLKEIPRYLSWMQYVSYFRYGYLAYCYLAFHGHKITYVLPSGLTARLPGEDYVKSYLGVAVDSMRGFWEQIALLVLMLFIFRCIVIIVAIPASRRWKENVSS